MNALVHRTLTPTWIYDSCMCIAWLTVYGVKTYPAPEQGSGTIESVYDLAVEGRFLVMLLQWFMIIASNIVIFYTSMFDVTITG